jgi:hypothetical protein
MGNYSFSFSSLFFIVRRQAGNYKGKSRFCRMYDVLLQGVTTAGDKEDSRGKHRPDLTCFVQMGQDVQRKLRQNADGKTIDFFALQR